MLLPLLLCLLPGACASRAPVSSRCSHLHFWNQTAQACVPCATGYSHVQLRGRQFTVNCGVRDTGGRFASPSQACPPGSFNNGTFLLCQPCSACPASVPFVPCTPESNTQCCPPGQLLGPAGRCQDRCCVPPKQCPPMALATSNCSSPMEAPAAVSSGPPPTSWSGAAPQPPPRLSATAATGQALGSAPATTQLPQHLFPSNPAGYGIWVVVLTTLLLTAAIALFIWTQQGHCPQQGSLLSAEETAGSAGRAGRCGAPQSCPAAPGAQLTTPAPPSLWGLPLQHLLDDADVLEELIMLLDPEGKAGGGTRHLASRYGLSATWINYTYSLRSTRSPLRATLETVAARQPEATLGQLAGLLGAMGRKDALQVLERVRCPPGPGTTPRGPGWRKETSQAIVHPGTCTPAPTRAGPGSPLLPLKHGAGLEGSGQP